MFIYLDKIMYESIIYESRLTNHYFEEKKITINLFLKKKELPRIISQSKSSNINII